MPRTDTGPQPRPRIPDRTETADLSVAVCSGSPLVVEIRGEIDIQSAPELRDELLRVIRRCGPELALDLADVTFMDCAGLNVLLATRRRAIFGKNVEDAFGSLRYLAFYFAGGFVAMLTQTAMTLLFGTAADARVPTLGASGAIAAVLGAYFVLYPGSRVRTYIFPVFLVRIPAWIFLGLWFLYQLIEANFGLFSTSANGGGVAFFAHVGGFVFGWVLARVLTGAGRITPRGQQQAVT